MVRWRRGGGVYRKALKGGMKNLFIVFCYVVLGEEKNKRGVVVKP